MSSLDEKKRFLSSRQFYTARRWEGKPMSFRFKYALANYPEFVITGLMGIFVFPPILYWNYLHYDNSFKAALTKFKLNYSVVRDDHPELEEIIKEKERGRHHFPSN